MDEEENQFLKGVVAFMTKTSAYTKPIDVFKQKLKCVLGAGAAFIHTTICFADSRAIKPRAFRAITLKTFVVKNSNPRSPVFYEQTRYLSHTGT